MSTKDEIRLKQPCEHHWLFTHNSGFETRDPIKHYKCTICDAIKKEYLACDRWGRVDIIT